MTLRPQALGLAPDLLAIAAQPILALLAERHLMRFHSRPWLAAASTAEVKELAVAIEKIFQASDTGREALAALQPFCEAAKQETATVELAQRVGEHLQRVELREA